ncbi:MAG: prepilin peptidase [Fuerstiella sp.]
MSDYPISLWLLLPALAVVGAFVGRFLNICAVRFPEHLELRKQLTSLGKPWTVCKRCSVAPSSVECIPILGWLINGRRCHSCKARIAGVFTVIELLTAALFVAVYLCEIHVTPGSNFANGLSSIEGPRGPEIIKSFWSPGVWLHLRYALHMLMICGLIVATEIDRRLRIIPDGSTVPITVFAIAASLAFGQLYIVPIWFQDASTVAMLKPIVPAFLKPLMVPWDPTEFIQTWPRLHGLLVSLAGAVAGAGSVWIVRQIGFLVLQQEAMGFGDVVLMAMIGSVIGWQPVLFVFVLAPLLAIFVAVINWVAHRDNEIPYGPFLSLATIVILLGWPVLWPLVKRMFDMGPMLPLLAVLMIVLLAASLQLVQLIKRLFGIQTGPPDDIEAEWTSADHLFYYNYERPDQQTGQWKQELWPGTRAGQGLKRSHDWRHHDH